MEAMSTDRTSRTVIEKTGRPFDNFSLAWFRSSGAVSWLIVSAFLYRPVRTFSRTVSAASSAEERRQRPSLVLEPVDGLDLEVLLEPEPAHRAADAGLLVAPHRRVGIRRRAVEADAPGSQTVHDAACPRTLPTEDVPPEPVGGVVGDAHGVVLVGVGDYRQDGAEHLLLSDGHLGRDVGEDGGLHEVAAVQIFRPLGPPGEEARTLVHATLDEFPDRRGLRVADHGAHGRRGVQRVAGVEAVRFVDEEA